MHLRVIIWEGVTLWHNCMSGSVHLVISVPQWDQGVAWREMEKPISLSCCNKQAKRDLSHVMVRRPVSCQGVANPDFVNMIFKQEQHARARCIIYERCEWGMRHLIVESVDAPGYILPDGEPLLHGWHVSKDTSLNTASYAILWSLPTRLYLCPSITSVIDPSEITPDPTQKSRRPAAWNLFPMVDLGGFKWYGMVWNATILNIMFLNLSCFQVILQSWHRILGRRRRHSPLVPGSPWYSEFVSGLHWPLMGC